MADYFLCWLLVVSIFNINRGFLLSTPTLGIRR